MAHLRKREKKQHISLRHAPPGKEFILADGRQLKDIKELALCFIDLQPSVFQHHVNAQNKKNDFAIWIHEVLEDSCLAQRLDEVTDQKQYTSIITERIKEIVEFR
jgi:hypothetical protein